VQQVIRIPRGSGTWQFVFGAQPLAEPPTGVLIHRSVGFAAGTEAKVVGPSNYLGVAESMRAYRSFTFLRQIASEVKPNREL